MDKTSGSGSTWASRSTAIGVVLLLACLSALAAATTGHAAAEPQAPTLSRSTVITAATAGRVLVELPSDLDVAKRDVENFRVGTDHVTVDEVDHFTALTLVSVNEQADSREPLPKFVAVKLPLPTGPQIVSSAQGFKPDEASVIPAGLYWLTVAVEDGATVSLEFPTLPSGLQHLELEQEVGYHVDWRHPTPLATGDYGPTFSDGFSHETTQTTQRYGFVWVGGDIKVIDALALCGRYGTRQQVAGVDMYGCGGEPTVGLQEIGLRSPYLSIVYNVAETYSARTWRVGGTYRVGGDVDGGGVLWLWVDA